MIRLSIITINYNNAVGLSKTIASVLAQTSVEYEYIVIDGGSTDESIDVIKTFQHKITYWVSEPDNGIYHAMNKGIRQAKGEYCHFLNSGDWLVNNYVVDHMLSKSLQNNILVGNMLKLQPNGTYLRDTGTSKFSFMTFYRGTFNHSASYIKLCLFNRYGMYDESLKIVSDWKFFLVAVGLNNESVSYQDVDVSYFDYTGVSSRDLSLANKERRDVLNDIIPRNILIDYDRYWLDIDRIGRLKKYKLFWILVNTIERLIFKYENLFFLCTVKFKCLCLKIPLNYF